MYHILDGRSKELKMRQRNYRGQKRKENRQTKGTATPYTLTYSALSTLVKGRPGYERPTKLNEISWLTKREKGFFCWARYHEASLQKGDSPYKEWRGRSQREVLGDVSERKRKGVGNGSFRERKVTAQDAISTQAAGETAVGPLSYGLLGLEKMRKQERVK